MPENVESEPEPFWVKSKWTVQQLDGQTIEFQLRFPNGDTASGNEPIYARARPLVDDRVHLEFVIEEQVHEWKKRLIVFQLAQKAADCIVLHPDQSIAHFQLVMP
jgi:hypothetical protein